MGAGTSSGADGVRTVGDVKLLARAVSGIDIKGPQELADEGRNRSVRASSRSSGLPTKARPASSVGVTADLVQRFSAVDLVRKGAEALGGKGAAGALTWRRPAVRTARKRRLRSTLCAAAIGPQWHADFPAPERGREGGAAIIWISDGAERP